MDRRDLEARLERCPGPAGTSTLGLRVADRKWTFSGLDLRLRDELLERWGPFTCDPGDPGDVRVEVVDAGDEPWLPGPARGEPLRLEAVPGTAPPAVVSYSFGLALRSESLAVLAVSRQPRESAPRVLDNAARILVARAAVREGGMALHGAGVVRDDRAWVFTGPSRSGKSTAVRLSSPAPPLGDDFALIVRRGDGWHAAAVPFDNAERVGRDRRTGTVPLARVCRIHKAPEVRVERPRGPRAVASLLSCAAFPWALPDLADVLASTSAALVRSDVFRHLHFAADPGFWAFLLADRGPA